MTMETTEYIEKKFKVNFKQNAKGGWQTDFTCRGETIEDLKKDLAAVRLVVMDELKTLKALS